MILRRVLIWTIYASGAASVVVGVAPARVVNWRLLVAGLLLIVFSVVYAQTTREE